MIKLVALKPHLYANKRMQPGDEYIAKGHSDATLMKALGWAEDAHEDEHHEQMHPQFDEAGELIAHRPAAKKTARKAPAKKSKSTYKRRDMQAE